MKRGDIGHDRGRVPENHIAIFQNGHLTQRIQVEEVGGLVRALGQIDGDVVVTDAEDFEERLNAVRIAGQRVAVEFHRGVSPVGSMLRKQRYRPDDFQEIRRYC